MVHDADNIKIQQVLADFEQAWNKHDARAFSMTFAEDADFTNVRGMGAHGRAAIEEFHAPLFATRFKDSCLRITKITVRFLRSDISAVDAWWEMTGAKTSDGQKRPPRKGLLNLSLRNDNGEWLIAVMHNMEIPASQPEPMQ